MTGPSFLFLLLNIYDFFTVLYPALVVSDKGICNNFAAISSQQSFYQRIIQTFTLTKGPEQS